jgi:hypothetical protein
MLGRAAVSVVLHWEGVQLAVSSGRCAVPHHRCGLFGHFGLLVDPAGNLLLDHLTMRAFPGCPPEPRGSFSMASSLRTSLQPFTAGGLFPQASSPLTGLYSSSLASTLHTGLSLVASTATCGTQVGASGSPRVNAPSGSRGDSLEAATLAGPPAARAGWVAKLLDDFPDVVNASASLPPPVHDVQHHIKTSGLPIASRFRRLEGAKLEAARKEFEAMERDGIVQRSTSPWASPLHMVPKKDGSWRPCGDFRRLNLVTEADVYPLPNMLDFSDRISGCTVFSKIDLRKGYWQVQVRPEDRQKTAVITPFGLFEFLHMPFGLPNTGSSFQRKMDCVLAGLPFAYCYLDNLRIASLDLQSHQFHLRCVLERLREFGLVINLEKCVFGVASFEFLGHVVSAQGARPIPSYVEAVEKRPPPLHHQGAASVLGPSKFLQEVSSRHCLYPATSHRCSQGEPAGFREADLDP